MKPFFGNRKGTGNWADKRGGSGGGYRGGAGGGRKFGGGGGGWQRNDDRDDRPAMFSATCAACDAPCQVPFKPDGRKPVFCSDCFRKDDSAPAPRYGGGNMQRSDRAPRASSSAGNDEIVKQLRTLNKKMDTLIQIFLAVDEEEEQDEEEVDVEGEEGEMEEVGFDDEMEDAEEGLDEEEKA